MSTPKPPPDLIEAMRNRQAIAIVGSGISIPAGAPTWRDILIGIVAEACETQPGEGQLILECVQLLHQNRFLDAADLLQEVLGPTFRTAVVRQLTESRDFRLRESELETDIALDRFFEHAGPVTRRSLVATASHRMLTQLNFRAIITTNYDQLLELAAPAERSTASFSHSYPRLAERVNDGTWFVLKLHGSIETPEDIVLTRSDYRKVISGQPLHDVLSALFNTYTKFWIGYGHNDLTLDLLVDEGQERLNLDGGFALARRGAKSMERRLKSVGIAPSWIDDYGLVPVYLRKLAEATECPLVFEVRLAIPWDGKKNADQIGRALATALGELGGDFSLFATTEGSVCVLLETTPSTLQAYRQRVIEKDRKTLEVLQQYDVETFDRLPTPVAVAGKISEGFDVVGDQAPPIRPLLRRLEEELSKGDLKDSELGPDVLATLQVEREVGLAKPFNANWLITAIRASDDYFAPIRLSAGQRDWQRDFAKIAAPILVGVTWSLERSADAQAVVISLCNVLAKRLRLKTIWPDDPDESNDLKNAVYRACFNAEELESDDVLVELQGLTVTGPV